MALNGRFVAVVDRFEDGQAILQVEKDGEVAQELVVDSEGLPDPAREPDAVLEVQIESGTLREMNYIPPEIRRQADDPQEMFDRLSELPPDELSSGEDQSDEAQ